MPDFKTWYEERYGIYPGQDGERYEVVLRRLADAFAEYATEVANAKR